MDYLFKFEYHVSYRDVGSENEICGTLLGIIENSSEFNLARDEISEIRWITGDELTADLKKNPEIYCPWMLIALFLIPSSEKSMLEKHKLVLSPWIESDTRKALEESIKYHFHDNRWRLIN